MWMDRLPLFIRPLDVQIILLMKEREGGERNKMGDESCYILTGLMINSFFVSLVKAFFLASVPVN